MLTQLTIQNFGLIEKLSLEFASQLNVLTGETGAGKSIVIDALRYVLGDRLASSQIRDPQLPCIVEAAFDLSKELRDQDIFKSYLTEDETQLIIHRVHLPDGKNKIKINGFALTIAQLKDIGNYLVDFHGPHDHQMLFTEESHRAMLDKLSPLDELKSNYDLLYTHYVQLQNELTDLNELGQSKERDINLLEHQLAELQQVPLSQDKYEELVNTQSRINNAEKLYEHASAALNDLNNEESGVSELIRRIFHPLRTLNQIDPQTTSYMESLNTIQDHIQNLVAKLGSYLDQISFQPEEARDINKKCDLYEDIKRKYGPSFEAIEQFYAGAVKKYQTIKNYEYNDNQLRQALNDSIEKLTVVAKQMTQVRKKTATQLEKTIENELIELGIAHVKFECRIEKMDLNPYGQDKITFYISPNAGEELKPLSQIISSGEAARLMLAMKKALIKVDPIPVLIFDEIDAQVGGRLGTITGTKLNELAQNRQVILITHLPQIASFGEHHFKINKAVRNGRAITQVQLLNAQERVKEIAKMMSGENETNISVSHAHEMLNKAKSKSR